MKSRIKPLIISLICLTSTANAGQIPDQGAVKLEVETKIVGAGSYLSPKEHVNQIDRLNVYKLSSYAYLLRSTHMMTLPLLKELKGADPKSRWHDLIQAAAAKCRIPEALIAAVIETESGSLEQAVSDKGAQGLMQLMPDTAADLGVRDPFDPRENIEAGSCYLAQQLNKYKDLKLALAAYNAGPARVDAYGSIPPFKETENFIQKVLARYQ